MNLLENERKAEEDKFGGYDSTKDLDMEKKRLAAEKDYEMKKMQAQLDYEKAVLEEEERSKYEYWKV